MILSARYRWGGYASILAVVWWLITQDRAQSHGQLVEMQPPTVKKPNDENEPTREIKAIEAAKADPFSKPAPNPPPPQEVKAPPPPPAPQAPPLPYRHFGMVTGPDGKETVFLTQGSRLLTVRQGEVVDGQYRVDKISDEEIVFTYLPLEQVQTARATR